MSREFFDDDLLQSSSIRRRNPVNEQPAESAISEAGMSRMIQQKEILNTQSADAVKEIEHLRLRQEQLEKERSQLEELTRKQEEYQFGKKEIMDKLNRSIGAFEKEEMQAARMVEILNVMRSKFKDTLNELKSVNEETWTDETFTAELDKAMVVLEDARTTFKKGMAKIEAAGWNKENSVAGSSDIMSSPADGAVRDVYHWMRIGFAFSAPVMIFLIILFIAWLLATGTVGGR